MTINIKHRREPTDPDFFDSDEIAEHVRHAVHLLSKLAYDHDGEEGLPLRPDAFFWATDYLFRPITGTFRAGGLALPTVILNHDGTLTVRFVEGLRCLSLHVLSKKVATHARVFEDSQTTIEGRLTGDYHEDFLELDRLVEWLLEDQA